MKFALNGGLILGTADGANIEIADAIGAHNMFTFGADVEEVEAIRAELRAGQAAGKAPPPLDDASWARIYEVRAGGPSRPQWEGQGAFRAHEGRAGGPSEVEGVCAGRRLAGKGWGPFRHPPVIAHC